MLLLIGATLTPHHLQKKLIVEFSMHGQPQVSCHRATLEDPKVKNQYTTTRRGGISPALNHTH